MKKSLLTLLKLFLGLFLYAVGIALTINADLGLSPWDVYHQGLSKLTSITMGQANIVTGLVILIIDWKLGERIGIGTICNMFFIGIFMDLLMLNDVIPVFHSMILRVITMLIGIFIMGIATYFYISVGLGSGPRDGIMVAITKKTNKSVRFVRNSMEFSVLIIGYLLGGSAGIGTLIMVVGVGYSVQFAFKIFKFDVRKLEHKYIDDHVKYLKEKLSEKKNVQV
ncbi:YczE/YyaS/YitT family protein [Clostridium cylindrosporum]|uniref:YitT family protein n=1 Tax=Clostridium cylindrosporum DSM 605 TaxID=1121307 RepID=A0A0J8DCE9_CLOCY|nr:membrane protein [Clostridium cylindrosporum]KMT21979.1 hypothetical protein CLCY_3c02500 [Clostridium cylindrosporum DSM 605]